MAGEQRPALRISDAERESAVRTLGEHHAVGRLTYDEFVERMDQAYEARTHEQLDALTADLPEAPAPRAQPRKRRWLVSVMGGNERAEDVAHDETMIVDFMGGSDLDLRAASFPDGEATVTAIAVMGGSTIWVPEGARVELSGFALMGGNSNSVPSVDGGLGADHPGQGVVVDGRGRRPERLAPQRAQAGAPASAAAVGALAPDRVPDGLQLEEVRDLPRRSGRRPGRARRA